MSSSLLRRKFPINNIKFSPKEVPQPPHIVKALTTENTTVAPTFARDEAFPVNHSTKTVSEVHAVAGIPPDHNARMITIFKASPNAMQSATHSTKPWRFQFNKGGRWANALMGWASTGDPLDATGLRQMRFDTKEQAIKFAEKMGFTFEVKESNYKRSFEGEKGYDKNFLNYHVKNKIDTLPPAKTSRSQFQHPERGNSTWMNLGNYAVQQGTSVHAHKKTVKGVDQSFWNSKQFDNKFDGKSSHYSSVEKAGQLARKLGK